MANGIKDSSGLKKTSPGLIGSVQISSDKKFSIHADGTHGF